MGAEEDERKKRLAEALRRNLRRRKAQARGASADPRVEDGEGQRGGDEDAD
jgi:hypothetical protein